MEKVFTKWVSRKVFPRNDWKEKPFLLHSFTAYLLKFETRKDSNGFPCFIFVFIDFDDL